MLELVKSDDFDGWVRSLRDATTKARVLKQVQRIQVAEQYVGDWKPVGGGVIEVRLVFGAGYRLYTAIREGALLLLLAGGDKSTQGGDIPRAQALLAEWDAQRAEEKAVRSQEGEDDGVQ